MSNNLDTSPEAMRELLDAALITELAEQEVDLTVDEAKALQAAEARWTAMLERERLLRVYFALGYFREMADIQDSENRAEQMPDEGYQAYLEGINCARGHLYQLGEIHATPEGPDDHPLDDEVAR